ncbi:phosphoribosylformylglycinamidine cyclo-ligase [Spirochaeta cellobiosiphila]|uniref:phosphoribosylformylglycinamidine cyclo-ligase n=1 Tax=Spirochaeta cellobiosiphila TaxID=504483 RepID=UPI000423DE6E|nr:phosphoribosylformylglycinamidine cyclo-ligase [Spirochaeta cellobiosiphila]
MAKTYASAGVDIEKGDRFANFISNINSKAVSQGLGGFAGGIEIDPTRYKKPVLLSATDGVGTKLIVGQQLKQYDTLGIDLVAMCVNDLIVCGAEPLVFLDYIACGGIDESILHPLMAGVVTGCEQAECTLAGGETAEMPDLYKTGDFDLAGFSVGMVDKDQMLPFKDQMKAGDVILGIPSAGIHSNGLSLARKVISPEDKTAMTELLKPTIIYVKHMKSLLQTGNVLGAAHITGGGLEGNIVRSIPDNLSIKLTWDWDLPWIFEKIRKDGQIEESEMRKVFNMGIGMAVICHPDKVESLLSKAKESDFELHNIGVLS